MQYYGKIIEEERVPCQSYKYNFLTDENEQIFFYNNRSLSRYLNAYCRLNVEKSNDGEYLCQSIKKLGKDITDLAARIRKSKLLIPTEIKVARNIKQLENSFAKRKPKPTPQQITKLRQTGHSWNWIADFWGVSKRTIRRRKKEVSQPKQKTGRKRKLTNEEIKTLLFYLGEPGKNTSTQREMANYLLQQKGKQISQATICRTLKREHITYKKITPHFLEQKPHCDKIIEFQNKIKFLFLFCPHLILFLDETPLYLNEVPNYAYAPSTSRAEGWKPSNKIARYTLIVLGQSKEKDGIVHYKIIKGGAKTKDFHDFIKEIKLPTAEKYYLLMDNASIHDAVRTCQELGLTTIKELLKEKNTEPLYLPPYTPELNPTELAFNFVKHYYRKYRPRTEEELKTAIEKTILFLQRKNLAWFLKHCLDYNFAKTDINFE